MKTFIASLLLLGFVQLSYAQSEIAYAANTNPTAMNGPERKFISPSSMFANEALFLAERSMQLQLQVFNYDIRNADVYAPETKTTYTVNFTEGDNFIEAIYAQDGRFIQSEGVFENVPIPYPIGYKLAKKYPGWEFYKSWCYSSFNSDQASEITYKILLKKANKTKVIKINL